MKNTKYAIWAGVLLKAAATLLIVLPGCSQPAAQSVVSLEDGGGLLAPSIEAAIAFPAFPYEHPL
jgi:hypothetical protein